MDDERAARERAEADRRRMRTEMQAERDKWNEEAEEERRMVDRSMRELRETIRKLRLEGAGASEEELEKMRLGTEEVVSGLGCVCVFLCVYFCVCVCVCVCLCVSVDYFLGENRWCCMNDLCWRRCMDMWKVRGHVCVCVYVCVQICALTWWK
jgi:hypothetical protein